MPELQPLTADHAQAVLAFERDNRAWFARSITERGDDYFARFEEGYAALLAEQAAGVCAFYVLVDADGAVVGRFNLYALTDGSADVGYRVAESAAGRGLATEALAELCRLAADVHDLDTLRAASADANLASQRVLQKAGFRKVGPAAPADLGGKNGSWWERELSRRSGA